MMTFRNGSIPTRSLRQALAASLIEWRGGYALDESEEPRVYFFLAADYGNLGDVAIAVAQNSFLQRHLPSHSLVTIPISHTRSAIRPVSRAIGERDIITITGGGNLGTRYMDIEQLRLLVIRRFPQTPIVSFPQTLDFGSTNPDEAQEAMRRGYSEHSDVRIFARESISRRGVEQLFRGMPGVHVGFAPDIVFSLRGREPLEDRNCASHAILALRQDEERGISNEDEVTIRDVLRNFGLRITLADTHVGQARIELSTGATKIDELIGLYARARVVVTDRLHGMILAVLAGTPCLALDNSSGKVGASYSDWLATCESVQFVRVPTRKKLEAALETVLHGPVLQWNPDVLDQAFSALKDSL